MFNLPNLSIVNFPLLNSSLGAVNMSNLPSLNQFVVANFLSGAGQPNMTISNTSLTSLPDFSGYGLVNIFNNSQLQNIKLTAPELDSLYIYSNKPTLTVSLPYLANTRGDIVIQNFSSIDMPAVTQILGNLVLEGSSLLSFSTIWLRDVDSIIIADNNEMASISFPNLDTSGNFKISNNNALMSFDVPSLNAADDLYISGNSLLKTISFPQLIGFNSAYLSGSFSR